MDNKLSELSKPVGFIEQSGMDYLRSGEDADIWPDGGRGDDIPLYSQEYVSALLAEIGEKERSLISNCVDYEYDLIEMKRRAEAAEQRVAELEAEVKVWESAALKHLARAEEAEKRLATPVRFKAGTDSVDSDVSDRNQPGMVVAVHVDAGDFVKVKGQVYEVKEACFDDHDVTLWFVCGEVLKCAAGCQIEVVSAPEGDA